VVAEIPIKKRQNLMERPAEVIKHNRFFTEGAPDIPHSSRNHAEDLQEFHLPLARMHHAHLHDLGIAGGLAIGVTDNGSAVEVQPGVAVDGMGELIALSPDGQADISLSAPGEEDRRIGPPFLLSTDGLADQTRYLTIQFAERLRLGQGAGGKLEQTPWLRLQPVAGDGEFVNDGLAIVLAVVQVDGTGVATVRARDPVLPHGRRLMGDFTSELRIRRATQTVGQVGQDLAAVIGTTAGGGLRIGVAEATDTVHIGRINGDAFAAFTVKADATQLSGSLSVQGDQQNQGNLLVVGEIRAEANFRVAGDASVDANLSVTGTTALGGNVQAQSNLKVDGIVDAAEIRQNGTRIVSSQWNDIGGGINFTAGRVGIGTTRPAAQLEVEAHWTGEDGALRLSGDKPTIRFSGGSISGNRSWLLHLGSNGPGNLEFHRKLGSAQWSPVLAMSPSGNVGIGEVNPSFQLSLGRSIASTKLALYETDPSNAYGLGVTAGMFRLHLGNPQARFAFLNSSAGNAREIVTIGGSGNLVVTGTARKPGGGSWADLSDRELKTDIRQLDGALDTLLRLRGVRFEWREPEKHGNLTGPQMGMLAQEVETVLPDWVSTTPEGYKLLSIRGFEALTVEALRELRTALSNLQAQNAALEALLQQLETKHG
jgi:hypothetical protein